ncbi:MAG: hypothetical protein KDF58_08340 [Alphaproteobacteria bacterium]|nr:hypothetical protein [Alphaproteobacteria bacterium]HRW30466.1 hypothetical protein [Emcibacteraceae bacterium]
MQNQSHNEAPVVTLIEITKSLTSILKEEMDCLKSSRPSEIAKFQKQKNILTASYQKELNDIKLNGGLASAGSGNIVRTLKIESREFQKTLEKHHRFIKAKKNLSEQMIKDISAEITSQSGRGHKYGRDAKMSSTSTEAKTTSLAINQTI